MDIPSYISGFIDGEGCFSISFSKRSKLAVGVEVRPSFSVSQNEKNLALLQLIHHHFGCGSIRYSKSDQTYKYEVRSITNLVQIVIPFFERYPLLGVKQKDFESFKVVCEMVYTNLHHNSEKLSELIRLAYTINSSGKRKLLEEELLKHVTR